MLTVVLSRYQIMLKFHVNLLKAIADFKVGFDNTFGICSILKGIKIMFSHSAVSCLVASFSRIFKVGKAVVIILNA